jgi:hypothetical protein
MVRCTGACLDHNNVSVLATWCLWTSERPLDLLRLIFRLWLHVVYQYMKKMATIKMFNAWVQRGPRRPSVSSAVMADGDVKWGSQSHRGTRKRGPLGAPPWWVSIRGRRVVSAHRVRQISMERYQSSRRAAMAVVEMAFSQEEENGIRGWGGSERHDVVGRGGGSGAASKGGSWLAATQARRPWAGGRGCSKHRRWGTDMWAPWHSASRLGQMAFNPFQNQF